MNSKCVNHYRFIDQPNGKNLHGRFMAPQLLTFNYHRSNQKKNYEFSMGTSLRLFLGAFSSGILLFGCSMRINKFHKLLLKSHITFADPRKSPNSEIQLVENQGKQEKKKTNY